MIETEFKVWLQGYIDLSDETHLDQQQLIIIKNHANLVIATSGKISSSMQEIVLSLERLQNKSQAIPREEILLILNLIPKNHMPIE